MEPRKRYRVTYTNADGSTGEHTFWSRFLPTDIAVFVSCGCTNIHWSLVK